MEDNALMVLDCLKKESYEHFIATYPIDLWESKGFFNRVEVLTHRRETCWIHCHWMTFEPAKEYVYFLFAMVYIALFIIGFSSNGFVIYIIPSTKKLLSPANILLVNLALGDLLIIFTVPISVFNSLHRGPAAGLWGCNMFGFIASLGALVAVLTLAAIAVERFLVISSSLNVTKKPTRSWAVIVSLVIWIFSIGFTGLPLVGLLGRYVPEGYLISCSFDYLATDWNNRSFVLSFFFIAWLFPLLVIMGSYVSILRIVIGTRENVALRINRGKRNWKLELDVAKNLAGLITIWMIAWTPYAVVALLGFAGYGQLVTPIGTMIAGTLGKSAVCVDPFVYVLNHPKIREKILSRFFSRTKRRTAGRISGSSSNRMKMHQLTSIQPMHPAGPSLQPPIIHRSESPNRLSSILTGSRLSSSPSSLFGRSSRSRSTESINLPVCRLLAVSSSNSSAINPLGGPTLSASTPNLSPSPDGISRLPVPTIVLFPVNSA